MTKYKYSRKQIYSTFRNYLGTQITSETVKNMTEFLLATVPEKKCEHKWCDSGNETNCLLCGICKPTPPEKKCEHEWREEITGFHELCLKCNATRNYRELDIEPTPPQLPVIEKIPIRIKDQTETTILVNQWDLAHKVNEVIDRLNLLSQRVCKEK